MTRTYITHSVLLAVLFSILPLFAFAETDTRSRAGIAETNPTTSTISRLSPVATTPNKPQNVATPSQNTSTPSTQSNTSNGTSPCNCAGNGGLGGRGGPGGKILAGSIVVSVSGRNNINSTSVSISD